MTVQNKKFLASILFLLISFVCTAQRPDPPRPRRGPPSPPGLPIDGASSIVLVIGVLYGAQKGIRLLKDKDQ